MILYSYHYTYHVLLVLRNNDTAIGSGLYITKTRCLRIYWPQYVHTYLQCHTPWLVVRAVWNRGWQREWSFSFPMVLLFVVVLRILYWAQYVRTCGTRPFTMHGWLCLPCGIADDKSSCLLLFWPLRLKVQLLIVYKKLKNVSCEYNREWFKLNFASCVVHQTRSYNKYGFCELNLDYDMIINTQFCTKYRPRVFYVLSLWRI